jgi:hypothetical protein
LLGPGTALLGGLAGGIYGAVTHHDDAPAATPATPPPTAKNPNPTPTTDPNADPALMAVLGQYADPADVNNIAGRHEGRNVDFDTPEGRKATLNDMIQNASSGDTQSNSRCGPTAVLAGAIQAGGRDGVRDIVEDVITKGPDGKPLDPGSKHLQEMIDDKSHKWTEADLNAIEMQMYAKMRAQEGDAKDAPAGIKTAELEKFINSDQRLAKMFSEHNEHINKISDDGGTNHFVLETDDDEGTATSIYDPYVHKDGNQVVTDKAMLKNYNSLVSETAFPRVDYSKK